MNFERVINYHNFSLHHFKHMFYFTEANVLLKGCSLKIRKTFNGKHLYRSFSFNKVAGLKKKTPTQAFSCEFCEIFVKNLQIYRFTEHLWTTASCLTLCFPFFCIPFYRTLGIIEIQKNISFKKVDWTINSD